MKIHINILSDDSGLFSASSISVHFQKVHSSPDDISGAVNYGPTHNVTRLIPNAALAQIATALNNKLDSAAVTSVVAAAVAERQAQGNQ